MMETAAQQHAGRLVAALKDHAARKGWTEAETARQFGVTLPRGRELLRDQIDRFQLDELVSMAASAGLRVELRILGQGDG